LPFGFLCAMCHCELFESPFPILSFNTKKKLQCISCPSLPVYSHFHRGEGMMREGDTKLRREERKKKCAPFHCKKGINAGRKHKSMMGKRASICLSAFIFTGYVRCRRRQKNEGTTNKFLGKGKRRGTMSI
jgi:hypothetical protein